MYRKKLEKLRGDPFVSPQKKVDFEEFPSILKKSGQKEKKIKFENKELSHKA